MKTRTSCLLTVLAVMAFVVGAHADFEYTPTLYYNLGTLSTDPCTTNLNQQCATTNLTVGSPSSDVLPPTAGFQTLLGTVIPNGATLTQVQVLVSNFLVGMSTDVGTLNNGSGTNDYYFRDKSDLYFGVDNTGTLFYDGKLITEERLSTTAQGATNTFTAWANSGPGPNINSTPNVVDGSVSADEEKPCNLSPSTQSKGGTKGFCKADQSGDLNYVNQNYGSFLLSQFNVNSTVPIFWQTTNNNVTSASNLSAHTETDYIGVEIQVNYFYNFPTQQTGVPEPATLLLLGSGLSFVGAKLRKRSVK
jgi:hypothetical protein